MQQSTATPRPKSPARLQTDINIQVFVHTASLNQVEFSTNTRNLNQVERIGTLLSQSVQSALHTAGQVNGPMQKPVKSVPGPNILAPQTAWTDINSEAPRTDINSGALALAVEQPERHRIPDSCCSFIPPGKERNPSYPTRAPHVAAKAQASTSAKNISSQ